MNTSTTRHPFTLPAFALSILITSTMTLIPTLASTGANHASRDGHTLQTTAALSQSVRTTV